MPLTTVTITGTIYAVDGSVVGANRSVTVVKVIKSGELVTLTRKIYKTDVDGLVTMTIPASSTAYIYANATGLNTNGIAGIPVTIPDTDADLSDLVTQASVPAEGITVKDEGISLANLVGTLNFVGSGVSIAEASPGVATVTISGGGGGGGSLTVEEVDGAPSATSVDTLKFDSADGFVLTNPSAGVARLDLNAIPYSKLTLTSSIVAGDLSDVELAAIAGLTSAADRLPYFTGSGTASLATFTSFGRSLVDDADASTARSTLGLGSVENTALSTWAGSTNVTTLGTIGTGTWNATAIGIGKGGTGAALTDPNADRILFWDDSAGAVDWLTIGSNLSITGTTLNASGGGGTDITIGTSVIISGTNTRVLYNNSGVVGEYTITGSGSVVMSASPTLTGVTRVGGLGATVVVKSAGYTATTSDAVLIFDTAATLTLPALATAVVGGNSLIYFIRNQSAGDVVLDPDSAETIEGASTATIPSGSSAIIAASATDWVILAT